MTDPSAEDSTTAAVYIKDLEATLTAGAALAQALTGGDVIYLAGDLGAGKTSLARGIIQALGHRGAVKSPTYTLVEPYELERLTLYHFDLYRLGHPEELEYAGARDYFDGTSVALVEWAERGASALPPPTARLQLRARPPGRELLLDSGAPAPLRQAMSRLHAAFK